MHRKLGWLRQVQVGSPQHVHGRGRKKETKGIMTCGFAWSPWYCKKLINLI